MVLLRVLARLTGVLWTLALALLGLGVAAYCFDGAVRLGSARPDRLIGLARLRVHLERFLHQISAHGPTAALALLGGLVGILLGVILLSGILRAPRERRAILSDDADGRLSARARTLREIALALTEQAAGVTAVSRPRIKLERSGSSGELRINASHNRASEVEEVEQAIRQSLFSLTEPFGLRARVRVRLGERGARAQ